MLGIHNQQGVLTRGASGPPWEYVMVRDGVSGANEAPNDDIADDFDTWLSADADFNTNEENGAGGWDIADAATDGYDLVVLNGFSTLASYWTNLKPADSPVPVLVLSTNYHHVDMADTHTTAFAWTGQPSLESLTPITFTHMTSLNDTQWLGAGGTTYGPTLDSVLPTDATKVWHVDNTADRPLLWTLESGDDDEAGNPLSVKVAVLPFVQLWRSASSFDSDGDETVMEVIQWLMT